MQRNKHRNKLKHRANRLYMVILPEAELRKRSIPNLLFIERKVRRLIGRIRSEEGFTWNFPSRETSAYVEYRRTIRRVYLEKSAFVA